MRNLSVQIVNSNGDVLWRRDRDGGIACHGYVVDGTQTNIIEVLKEAVGQAEAELRLFDVRDGVSDIGRTTA